MSYLPTVRLKNAAGDLISPYAPLDVSAGFYDPFGKLRVTESTPIIELKSTYGLSALRDVVTVTGSGTVTNTSAEYRLQTTANGADTAALASAERGRYQAGYSAEAGIGVRTPDTPAGAAAMRWGLFDAQDGWYFGRDATGVFVAALRGGSETKVYQADWNADTLDGNGPSGFTLDVADGHVYQVLFSWYGFGVVEFRVMMFDASFKQVPVVVHRLRYEGGVSVMDPNLPITASVINGGEAAALNLYVAGRQYSVLGRFEPNRRINADFRLGLAGVTTTFLPMITARRKAAFDSVSVKVEGFDLITGVDLLVQLRLNASLTGASYGTPQNTSAAETAVETDIAATAVSGGEILWEGLINSVPGGGGFFSIGELGFDFVQLQPVTLCARATSGSGAVSSVFRVREEW